MSDARTLLLAAAALAALAAFAGLVVLWRLGRSTGLPTAATFGRGPAVVASDTGVAGAGSVLLRDPVLGLRGRPDYLIEERSAADDGTRIVPVELKPSRRSSRLYESDAVQLGAYLLALRATYGERMAAGYGYVRYAEHSFRVALTPSLEARVRAIVAAVRTGRRAAVVHRSHDVPARCRSCPVREWCDERLA